MLRHVIHTLGLRRTQIWLLLLALLALWLAFIPLFNLLAYEFCLALAASSSLAAAHLGSVQVASARQRDEGMVLALRRPLSALFLLVLRCLASNLLLLLLPVIIILLNALRVKNCDILEGLAFFAMMPVLSVAVASCVGMLWALALPGRQGVATLCAVITVLASIGWGVFRFYDTPAIFGYDPFVGYFPGSLYDEDVAIQPTFIVYRLYNLVWLGGILLFAAHFFQPSELRLTLGRWHPTVPLTLPTVLLLLTGVLLFDQRGAIGFSIDAEQLSRALRGLRYTQHFVIHHPVEMDEQEVDLLAQDHEFRYAQLKALLGKGPPRVTSFVFASDDQKRRLTGAGRIDLAKPWRREIFLTRGNFPHRVLKHELAHVFAGEFGDRIFKVSLRWSDSTLPYPLINVGLIEGLAVALDWRPYGEMTGHQLAAALTRIGLAPPIRPLFGYGFLRGSAGRSYILAGSFIRHLLTREGARKLAAVYRNGGDFRSVYHASLDSLIARWKRWLRGVQVTPAQLQLAGEHFRRPSILRRVCGHEVANLLAEARSHQQSRRYRQAAQIYRRICSFDPGEPLHLLRWMEVEAAAQRYRTALDLGSRLLDHPALSKPLQRKTLMLMGDLSWLNGDLTAASNHYNRAAAHPADPLERRVLLLKRWAMQSSARELRDMVQRYLVRRPGTSARPALEVHLAHSLKDHPESLSGLGHFLVGKQLAARRHCVDAVPALEDAIDAGLPNPDFVIEAYRVLGDCQYRNSDYIGSSRTFSILLEMKGIPKGTRNGILDWLHRLHFRRTGKLLESSPVRMPMISN